MPKIDYSYETILGNWDVKKEQQKADFIEHIYQCYQPGNHCYTGLWQRFCQEEAGPYCRDLHFERKEALEQFLNFERKEALEQFLKVSENV